MQDYPPRKLPPGEILAEIASYPGVARVFNQLQVNENYSRQIECLVWAAGQPSGKEAAEELWEALHTYIKVARMPKPGPGAARRILNFSVSHYAWRPAAFKYLLSDLQQLGGKMDTVSRKGGGHSEY